MIACISVWVLPQHQREKINLNKMGNYAIISALVAVNKTWDPFKDCKFHLATTEKMGKIKLTSLVHYTGKGLSDQRTAAQHTSHAKSITSLP